MFAAILPRLDSEIPVATYGSMDVNCSISPEVSTLPSPWNILTKHSLILSQSSIEKFMIAPSTIDV